MPTDDADGAGAEPAPVPPLPAAEPAAESAPGASDAGTAPDPDIPQDPEAEAPPPPPAEPPFDADPALGAADVPAGPEAPPEGSEPEADDEPWWARPAVRDELREVWDEHSADAREAAGDIGHAAADRYHQAVEVGAMIGDAIADRLPDPYVAAQKKGLDLRWLHLKLNVPALVIAVAAWWGIGPADPVSNSVRTDGVAAPLGWVLMFVLLGGALMLLPIGSSLASAVAHLVTALAGVLGKGLARAWRAPYLGYLLRLVVVTIGWVVIIGFVRLVGRALLTWLTGV